MSYHAAADLVCSEGIEATHPDAPTTFLYSQAVELYLKAFLRLKDDSTARLWAIGHNLRKLKSRAAKGGLRLGKAESEVLDWMVATKVWQRARYLETGSTWMLRGTLVRDGCSSLKATVIDEFRRAGQPVISPQLQRPFRDLFARLRDDEGTN